MDPLTLTLSQLFGQGQDVRPQHALKGNKKAAFHAERGFPEKDLLTSGGLILGFFGRRNVGVDPLDQGHGSRVGAALAELDDAGVTSRAISAGGSDLFKQHFGTALGKLVAAKDRDGTTTAVQGVRLAKSHELVSKWTQSLSLGQGCFDLLVLNEAGGKVAHQGLAVGLVALKFYGLASVSHQ